MTLAALHTKQTVKRQSKDLERIMRDEPTTIHPIARARGVTHDDICEGMHCTVRLASFTEGPATITAVEHSKNGRAWRVRVRPEFDAISSRYERSWAFTLSDRPASRLTVIAGVTYKTKPHPFFAYRQGSVVQDALSWQHRRLLVGHAESRDHRLTEMIASTRLAYIPRTFKSVPEQLRDEQQIDEFYASTAYGVSRFLTSQGIGVATPDTLDSLLGQAGRPAEVPRCP